jgi:hypothetical protein
MMIVFQDTPKDTPKHAGPGGNRTFWAPGYGAILLKGLADLPSRNEPADPATFRPNASGHADGIRRHVRGCPAGRIWTAHTWSDC